MPYRVIIKDNDTKADIAGVVFLYDANGNEIGESTIPKGGAEIDDNAAWDDTAHIEVNASGYYSYGLDTDVLYELITVYLVKRENKWASYVIGGLIALVGMNVLAKRRKKLL